MQSHLGELRDHHTTQQEELQREIEDLQRKVKEADQWLKEKAKFWSQLKVLNETKEAERTVANRRIRSALEFALQISEIVVYMMTQHEGSRLFIVAVLKFVTDPRKVALRINYS